MYEVERYNWLSLGEFSIGTDPVLQPLAQSTAEVRQETAEFVAQLRIKNALLTFLENNLSSACATHCSPLASATLPLSAGRIWLNICQILE